MANDELEELKSLSPQERIRKLKEIEERDKKEIEKAQRLIKESVAEIEEGQREKAKIPIPQLKSVDISNLFTQEEKDLFKAKRYAGEKKKEVAKEVSPAEKPLEQTLFEATPRLSEEQVEEQRQYQIQLSQQPTTEIYQRMSDIYAEVKESGQFTDDNKKDINNLYKAMQYKMRDVQAGSYNPDKEAARKAVGTIGLAEWFKDRYR